MTHQWIILAYETSPYLASCIESLLMQTVHTEIRIATSTPNEALTAVAAKYDLPVIVHEGGSIAADWNGALQAADADYVTLAHQDDVYEPEYASKVMAAAEAATMRGEQPQILFTDYYELRGEEQVSSNRNLGIKEMLLRPVRSPWLRRYRVFKRMPICLGNAICCPAVTYVRAALPDPEEPFMGGMGSNIDWQLWEELSRRKGSFVYVPERLMGHRIHEESTTSELIADSRRAQEDLYMLERFWPRPVARCIEHWYRRAEESNRV